MEEQGLFPEGCNCMLSYVLDASVVLSWIEDKDAFRQSFVLQEKLMRADIMAYAPGFLLVEVLNVLANKYGYKRKETEKFLTLLPKLPIRFIDPSFENIQDIIDVVYAYTLSGYDAQYLGLARAKQCKLISLDKKLLRVADWVITPAKAVG